MQKDYLVILQDENGKELFKRAYFEGVFAKNIIIKGLCDKTANKNLNFPAKAILFYENKKIGEWQTNTYKQKYN